MRLNYSNFRFKAVVDFVEIEIRTVRPSNGGAIKRNAKIAYAEAIEVGAGGAASIFRIKLYDLANHTGLLDEIERIEKLFPFTIPATITALEVAFDGYRKLTDENPATRHDLIVLAARLSFMLANPASVNRRVYHKYKGSGSAMPKTLDSMIEFIGKGYNVAVGNNGNCVNDPISQHGYFADHDRGNYIEDESEHSARSEVRIVGNIGSLAGFQFQSLAKHLYCRTEAGALPNHSPQLRELILKAQGSNLFSRKNSKRVATSKGGQGGTSKKFSTPADRKLNAIIYAKLRELSIKWA